MNTNLLRRVERLESESLPEIRPRHFVVFGDEQLPPDYDPEIDSYHRIIFGRDDEPPTGTDTNEADRR